LFGNNPSEAFLTTLQQLNNDADWADISINPDPDYVIAIKTNGTLWTWGLNPIVPDVSGMRVYNQAPTQIGTDTDWKMANGKTAIKTNGTLWQNSANGAGYVQLGAATDWDKVWSDGVVTKTDGTLWTWGNNNYGQLGNGTVSMPVARPAQVGTDTWKMVTSSKERTNFMGIKTDGTLWVWGRNNGLFGDTTDSTVTTPTQIDTATDWDTVSYSFNALGLKTNGAFAAWTIDYLKLYWPHSTVGEENMHIPTEIQNCEAALGTTQNTLSQITLYPNPTSSILHLANAENLSIENITITDLSGKTVLSQKGNAPQVNVQSLPQGMYFFTVSAKEGQSNFKFIKE